MLSQNPCGHVAHGFFVIGHWLQSWFPWIFGNFSPKELLWFNIFLSFVWLSLLMGSSSLQKDLRGKMNPPFEISHLWHSWLHDLSFFRSVLFNISLVLFILFPETSRYDISGLSDS